MITLFGLEIPMWLFILVIVVVVLLVVGIPIYQGYKKEMAKTAKKGSKSGAKKGSSGSKKR